MTSDGYIMLVVAVLGAVLCLPNLRWSGLIARLLVGASLVYVFTQIEDRINSLSHGSEHNEFAQALSRAVSPGMGFAIIGLGALLLVISPWFFKEKVETWDTTKIYGKRDPNERSADDMNELKSKIDKIKL